MSIKSNSSKIPIIFLVLFGLTITIALIFRGLFFENDQLPFLIFIYTMFISFIIYNIKNRDIKLLTTPIDYAFFGIVLMYMFSIFYGVNKREAILEFGRHLSYFMIYIVAKDFAKEKKNRNIILNTLIFGGIIVVSIGIGTAAGTWNFRDAMLGGRLSSTFQYPNTLASYVVVLYIVSLTLLINEDEKIYRLIYGSTMGIFLFSLILSYSRAMWLLFPIVILLFFMILPNTRKLESILYIIASAMVSIPITFIFNMKLEDPGIMLWILFLLSGIGTGTVILLVSSFAVRFRSISMKKLLASLVVIGVLFSVLLIHVISATTELTLENISNEDKMTTIIRNISTTIPNGNYKLEVDYTGYNKNEIPYIGFVRVYNIDSKGESVQIASENLVNLGDNKIEMSFVVLDDSLGVKIYFQNYYKNTKIIFKEARIYDAHNSQLIKNVPLKYKYINENIINRIQSINTRENNFTARMIFNKDGLKVLSQNPMIGAGGGGWISLYQKYQSYSYWTTLAHNFILQLWIEIGTVGLLLYIIMLSLISNYAFKLVRKSDNISDKVLTVGLISVVFSMILHGVVDFDMSFPAYSFIFWTILGLLVSQFDKLDIKNRLVYRLHRINPKIYSYFTVITSLVIIYNFASIIYSNKYRLLAIEASETNNLNSIIENYERIIIYDKYEPSYKIDLANAYIDKYSQANDVAYAHKAIELADEYIRLSPFDSTAHARAAFFNLSIGEIDKGIEQLEKSVELQPMSAESYIQKINGYISVAEYYLSQGENNKAKEVLKQALEVKEDIKKVNKEALEPFAINFDLIKTIGDLQYLYENIDNFLTRVIQGLELNFAYYFDFDMNNDGNIDMLNDTIPEGSKIEHKYINEEEENFIRITNEGEVFGFNYVYPLNLEPETTYVVELKARGTTRPETFSLYAGAVGTADPNQGGLLGIELMDEWSTYTFEFTTDEDVEPENQYIRMHHNGNDKGYIDVKELVIFIKK